MKTTSCTTHRGIAIFWVLAFLFLARPYNKLQGKHYLYSSFSNPSDPLFLSTNHATQVVLGNDFVYETLTVDGLKLKYKQLEGGFTQPNAFISGKMLEWAKSACLFDDAASGDRTGAGVDPGSVVALPRPRRDDFLELYCGNGNFTLPLAQFFRRSIGTEISKTSIASAQRNCELNDVDSIDFVRLSGEETACAMRKEREFRRLRHIDLDSYNFTTVLVDPPRAGLDEKTLQFIAQFQTIIYISCNPTTLANNLTSLTLTHCIDKFAAFDQFPYSEHCECGVILKRTE